MRTLFLQAHRVFGRSHELLREISRPFVDDGFERGESIVRNDGVDQLAASALEGGLVGAERERALALGTGEDVDELSV